MQCEVCWKESNFAGLRECRVVLSANMQARFNVGQCWEMESMILWEGNYYTSGFSLFCRKLQLALLLTFIILWHYELLTGFQRQVISTWNRIAVPQRSLLMGGLSTMIFMFTLHSLNWILAQDRQPSPACLVECSHVDRVSSDFRVGAQFGVVVIAVTVTCIHKQRTRVVTGMEASA